MTKKKSAKTTAIKDHKNIDQLLIKANLVSRMLDSIFTFTETPHILTHEDSVSMMLYDMALLFFKYDNLTGNINCVISVQDECSVLLIAELMCCLKDLFKENVYVNNSTFLESPTGGDLIWGRENIDTHHDAVWGKKILHSIMFDDSCAGHS